MTGIDRVPVSGDDRLKRKGSSLSVLSGDFYSRPFFSIDFGCPRKGSCCSWLHWQSERLQLDLCPLLLADLSLMKNTSKNRANTNTVAVNTKIISDTVPSAQSCASSFQGEIIPVPVSRMSSFEVFLIDPRFPFHN
jgi:hypothetical protein